MARQVVRYCSDVGAVISASFWPEITLIIPLYVGTVSIVTLLLHLLWVSRPGLKLRAQYFKTVTTEPEYAPEAHSIAEHVESHGGITIFSFKAARLVGCLVLLNFSIVSLASDSEDDEQETSTLTFWETKPHKSLRAMVMTYFYASVLAIISVAGSAKWGTVAVKHLNTLLLSTSAVYFYRDVFPLATNELVPLDLAEGRVLWVKIMTLFTVSGIIPLLIPRQYIPVDPKNPMPLPPLCDYDYAENLRARAWPHMDVFSGKKRHIFFDIIWIYRWTFWGMAVMLTVMALAAFISPIGINRLLAHLEDPNQASSMKPWFWILLLFLGPTINSLAFQWYIFISTHIMTQTTAIITQLVFEHALRIRVKSETGGKGQVNAVASGRSKKASANLHGKMTNLVTTDLTHINEAIFSRASRTFASLNRWVTMFSVDFFLERIQSYLTIEQEPKPTASGIPPAYWPASGNLSVDNLSAKYSPDGPTVLHNISFNIKSGERVGVVGRTGSGKSSLTLSLLRCIFTEGTVSYDGLYLVYEPGRSALKHHYHPSSHVGQPELFVGSLRSNLDVLGQFDDVNLNAALRSAGLSSLQEDMDEGKLTLDSEISAGGSNLSVGQRQIIALARAIVRGSKLMILDEATSAIDYKTDEVIQSSLRTELPRDTTLLIVAHRLQTIMDADKIMVFDAGRIVEFDTPKALLQKKHGLLRSWWTSLGTRRHSTGWLRLSLLRSSFFQLWANER
ncbi:P-loop containing nucleoside triphosphate hydrolase protein [Mycena leptocephala]|nr:P-loop containing nucleoside triphosphate hydrolase protein [Mycena leptocephala]